MRRRAAGARRVPAGLLPVLGAASILAGCAGEPEPRYARYQVFCYRTLADVECVPRPEPGAERRFTGVAWSGPIRLPVPPAEGREVAVTEPVPQP